MNTHHTDNRTPVDSPAGCSSDTGHITGSEPTSHHRQQRMSLLVATSNNRAPEASPCSD